MSEPDSWEARMAARHRERHPELGPDVCAVCGTKGSPRLRYGNIKTGARYCCEEHVKRDPAWSDDSVWIAGVGE